MGRFITFTSPRLKQQNILFSLISKRAILQMFRRRVCLSLVLLPVSCYDVSFLSYKLLLLCFLGGGLFGTSATLGSFFPTDPTSLSSETLERKKRHICEASVLKLLRV